MKNFKKYLFGLLVIAPLFAVLMSCNDSEDQTQGTSKVAVRMTDAPGDYDEVNVEVLDVMIKGSSDAGDNGWVSLGNIQAGVYNLLDLTGGINVLLGENTIPSGQLSQIRLVLGDENTVVKDGVTYPLNTPSAQQSGLKIQVNQMLQPGGTYNFLLDFDVAHSVVVEAGGSGNYNLHPVIRVTTEATSGAIKGTISPIDVQTLVAVQVNGTAVSAYTNEAGVFQLNGIPSGTYTVTVTPDPASGLAILTIDNVVVVNGEVTNLGNLVLQ
ncbi:DUF4382 domain-containing protein [Flavobacterium sp. SM15]|uniref:DUF4382 domain-containing protein n=1 Tax=Flavobacterium sp. SM15 TaxID=2908005 RepID=UPI001EDA73B0|nr:DUF4382 domain-containing protein [Flavobacterium sp. SM15]MCG2612296.1 DUF4382 domain-containing protein [Flavobacterium sp. SM15]